MHAGPAAQEPEHGFVERDPLCARERADTPLDLVTEAPNRELPE
jgi:hypothetical protein